MSEATTTIIRPQDLPELGLRLTHIETSTGGTSSEASKSVLLLHGASADSGTFTAPLGKGVTGPVGGLAGWLAERPDGGERFDVWLLDWRGSKAVIDDQDNKGTLSPGKKYNFNAAAKFDIRAAIDEMLNRRGVTPPISVIGHCMGGGILAEAIAQEYINERSREVDCIVLSTLGLFYETPIDSRMKSEDRMLERLAQAKYPGVLTVDPRIKDPEGQSKAPWPDDLERLFENWPGGHVHEAARDDEKTSEGDTPLDAKAQDNRAIANHMCNRLAFMYGMVYNHSNLAKEIHASDRPTLPEKFGAIPLHMYIHAARNIRQGRATTSEGALDEGFLNADFLSEDALARFRNLSRVTLITGALNRLWHRESIDLMHEWLCRGSSDLRKVRKRVFQSYGHQDLLWGAKAPSEVFPTIAGGLTAQAPAAAASISRH